MDCNAAALRIAKWIGVWPYWYIVVGFVCGKVVYHWRLLSMSELFVLFLTG